MENHNSRQGLQRSMDRIRGPSGDGKPEFVCNRSLSIAGENFTASAIAYTLDNKVLWKWGDPEGHRETLGSDMAYQSYDWVNDGKNEVILSTWQDEKTWLVELEGATGKEKRAFRDTGRCSGLLYLLQYIR